jgi:hypothetical protein
MKRRALGTPFQIRSLYAPPVASAELSRRVEKVVQ